MAAGLAVLTISLAWAYWPALARMFRTWYRQSEYSHGYLIPLFALALLWFRADRLASLRFRPEWWGLGLVGLAALLRFSGAYLYIDWLEEISLLPCLAGLCVLAGGWPALGWAWPAILFLVFMIPLPYKVEKSLADPLQAIATKASTYALQTMGFPAVAEGHTIRLNQHELGVERACSGLSMLLVFFALSTLVAVVVKRPLGDRIVVLLSAVPIAVIANVVRITTIAIGYVILPAGSAQDLYKWLHDWGGLVLLTPLALGLLWLELKLIEHLLVEPESERPGPAVAAAAGVRR